MTTSSFKLKFALLSALLSGIVLLAIGCSLLFIISEASYRQVDSEIGTVAYPKVRRLREPDYWPSFETSLRFIFGDEAALQFIVKVFDHNGQVLYASPHWPKPGVDRLLIARDDAGKQTASLQLSANPLLQLTPLEPAASRQRPLFGISDVELFRLVGLPFARTLRAPVFATISADGKTWRTLVMGNEKYTLIVGKSLAETNARLKQYYIAFAIAVPIAIILLLTVGLLLARQALRPVQLIAQTASHITVQYLWQRVPPTSAASEFQHLIGVINEMLDRLERSFQQASRFSADAAHELKTPLTILQGQIDQALQTAPDGSPEQQVYTDWIQEVQRLGAIVRKLLLLAQADSGQLQLTLSRVNLSVLVASTEDDLRVIAPHLSVRMDIARDVWVEADADLLNQLLRNLTSNAVKFNEEHGQIEIQLRMLSGLATLSIANTGRTIPPEDRDRVFHRFYRADRSRGRCVDGVGLGLSLSREIARAHHGDLVLRSERPGWTEFVLTLPNTKK